MARTAKINTNPNPRQRRRGVTTIGLTPGGEYTLKGEDFVGVYHIMSDGTVMVGDKHRNRPRRKIRKRFRVKSNKDIILQPVPKVIEETEDVKVTSTESEKPTETQKRVEIVEGDVTTFKVGNIEKDGGSITIFGDYEQNQVDIPTYDLSTLNVIDDPDVTFDFVLSIKDGEESEPKLYVTSEFYNALIRNYNNNQPFQTNDIIQAKNIVVVDIKPLKEKVEDLRNQELELDINLTTTDDKKYVEVFRNLFVNSNYEKDNVKGLNANPTYTILELLRYISWVVSKPAQSYDERLIPAELLGEYGSIQDTTPSENEPSKKIEDEKDDDGNSTDPSPKLYPPIGRKGIEDAEEVFYNGKTWTWFEDTETWNRTNSDGDPKGGGFKDLFDRD